jgi:hypothetical protein
MSDWLEVPDGPITLEEMLERAPLVRQSLLAAFDDCELSTLFKLRYENGWSTSPQARGTIFHRVAAECLRQMRESDSTTIPIGTALAILEETLYQRDVPPRDRVRVPLREMPDLELDVIKFAKDNSFNVRNIIDVERRVTVPLVYEGVDGRPVERQLSGQIDALIARPPDEAVVLDWKSTWALPPLRDEDADKPGVSYHGYFQQQFYAWLVMRTFPAINAVSLREFYVRRTQARSARVTRQDLPKIEQRLRYLVASFDRAMMVGAPPKLSLRALEAHGSWIPSPGKHCDWCAKPHRCPIDDDYTDGGIRTPEDAARAAGVRQRAVAVKDRMDKLLQPWVELHGPIPIKRAKGRLVLGYRRIKGGLRWGEYTPQEGDRPSTESTEGARLEEAMRASVEEARAQR